jgi:hypothetical protein
LPSVTFVASTNENPGIPWAAATPAVGVYVTAAASPPPITAAPAAPASVNSWSRTLGVLGGEEGAEAERCTSDFVAEDAEEIPGPNEPRDDGVVGRVIENLDCRLKKMNE